MKDKIIAIFVIILFGIIMGSMGLFVCRSTRADEAHNRWCQHSCMPYAVLGCTYTSDDHYMVVCAQSSDGGMRAVIK